MVIHKDGSPPTPFIPYNHRDEIESTFTEDILSKSEETSSLRELTNKKNDYLISETIDDISVQSGNTDLSLIIDNIHNDKIILFFNKLVRNHSINLLNLIPYFSVHKINYNQLAELDKYDLYHMGICVGDALNCINCIKLYYKS